MVTQQKELVLYINKQEKGIIASGLPEIVFGFIELYVTGDSVRLVPSLKEVRRYIKFCSCR